MKFKLFISLVLLNVITFSQNKQDLPLNENFDASSSMPAGWTLETTTYDWEIQDWDGGKAIVNPWNNSQNKSGWFFTPGLELTAGSVYFIKFMMKAPGYLGSHEALRVKVGNNPVSSSMTELLFENDNIVDGVFTEYILNYSPNVTGTFYVGWQAFSPANQDYITIDEISIYEAPNVDISIKSTMLPVADLLGNSPNSNLKVKNLSNQVKTFDVKLTINDGVSDLHSETVVVTDLGIAEDFNIDFLDFTINSEGSYTYTYEVIVGETDDNPADNILIKEVNIIEGCNHKLSMTTTMQPMGWLGATMNITSNGVDVLTNATLINGNSEDLFFPSSEDASLEVDFDNLGEWQTNCHWEIFDGEDNSLTSGTGTTSGNHIVQNVIGNCAPALINSINEENNITITNNNNLIKIQTNNNYYLSVFDLLGRNIMNKIINGNTSFLFTNDGTYLLKFKNENSNFTKKIIIQ